MARSITGANESSAQISQEQRYHICARQSLGGSTTGPDDHSFSSWHDAAKIVPKQDENAMMIKYGDTARPTAMSLAPRSGGCGCAASRSVRAVWLPARYDRETNGCRIPSTSMSNLSGPPRRSAAQTGPTALRRGRQSRRIRPGLRTLRKILARRDVTERLFRGS